MTQTRKISGAISSIGHTADQVISSVYVKGPCNGQNITAEDYAGSLLIDNVVSVDAFGSGQFDGQGAYLNKIAGRVTIQNSYFGYCGRPRNGYQTPTMFRHGVYANDGIGGLVVTGCIFAQCANAGLQSRVLKGPSVISGCVFLDCGTALLLIEGGATVTDCLIYGAEFYFDGSNWTGGTAIKSYWPLTGNGNWIFERPNQGNFPASPTHPAPGAKLFPSAQIDVGGKWGHQDPAWTPPPGYPNIAEYMSGSGNIGAAPWPGARSAGPTKLPGWSFAAQSVPYDYAPVLAEVEAGGDVAAAIATIKKTLLASA